MITRIAAMKLAAFTLAGATAGAGALAAVPSDAASGGSGGKGTSHSTAAQHPGRLQVKRFLARHVLHADWTTRDGKDHAAIRGTVKAVSAHALVIRAKDGTSQTWQVGDDTLVRIVGDGHQGRDSFADVKVGDQALVGGTGDHDARRLLARTPQDTTPSTPGASTS